MERVDVLPKRKISPDLLYIPFLINGLLIGGFAAYYFFSYQESPPGKVIQTNAQQFVKKVFTP